MISLRDLPECFEGIIPAMMTTCSLEGEPNITEISQVHLVDDRHVALSHQFFNKTQRNVRENPYASVLLFSPRSFDQYRLQLRLDHSESDGPLFEEMAARLQVIASHTGMCGVFRLVSADVYEVLSAEHVEGFLLPPDPRLGPPRRAAGRLEAMARELRGLQAISGRVNRAGCLEVLLESVLQALDEELGFRHSMVLLPDERGRLVTTASHGYGSGGVGAEVPMGEGLIGTVAARKRPMRVAGVGAELRYWRTIRAELQHAGQAPATQEIPLPGLADAQAQLALPLLIGDRLVGVLALESREAMAFDVWTETFLNILANQIALGIDRAASADDEAELPAGAATGGGSQETARRTRVFQLFRNDDCIFVDGEYLIRNIPAKIPLEAAAGERREWAHGVQQPRAPPRRLARAARGAGQPGIAADPFEEAAGGEVPGRADPFRAPRAVRAADRLHGAAEGERFGLRAASLARGGTSIRCFAARRADADRPWADAAGRRACAVSWRSRGAAVRSGNSRVSTTHAVADPGIGESAGSLLRTPAGPVDLARAAHRQSHWRIMGPCALPPFRLSSLLPYF